MRQKPPRNFSAFTIVELLVVVVVLGILASMVLPAFSRQKHHVSGVRCHSNLMQAGISYRLWSADNGGFIPSQQSISNGGWKELLTNANQGPLCWSNFAIMQNEFGQSPRTTVCPLDERTAATNFSRDFDNTHLSYFVGVSASTTNPKSILGGDRNLGGGRTPAFNYGLSLNNGRGNDVAVPLAGPVSWSLTMHSASNAAGAGNILFCDGSVQCVTTAALNQSWLPAASPTTNWPAGSAPAVASIRLVFP